MKIRPDAVFISSVLYTIALLLPLPAMLENAATWREAMFTVGEHNLVQNWRAPIGFASLSIIVIGLIVTWTGYIRGVRWTWPVLFIIAWGWAFPVLVLPIVQSVSTAGMTSLKELLSVALREPGPQRSFAMYYGGFLLTLLLMTIALLLPIRTLVRRRPE